MSLYATTLLGDVDYDSRTQRVNDMDKLEILLTESLMYSNFYIDKNEESIIKIIMKAMMIKI